jgi:uncharacterized membrane protein YjfL (UPF0719 family)
MNYIILLQAALAFSIGVASLFMVYKLLNIYLKKAFGITELNHAYATLQTGILLSAALLISSIIGPGMNAIRFLNQTDISLTTISSSMGYVIMFAAIGVLFSMIVVAGGIVVLFQLTHINEWEEIRKNNLPVALVSAALILSLAIIMKDQVSAVCEMLIPYPEVLHIH